MPRGLPTVARLGDGALSAKAIRKRTGLPKGRGGLSAKAKAPLDGPAYDTEFRADPDAEAAAISDPTEELSELIGMTVFMGSGITVVGTAAWAVFRNGRDGDMVFDDVPAILKNPDVLCDADVGRSFRNNFWGEDMAAFNAQHQSYRPLTTMSFRWDNCAAGMSVQRYHDVNIALHVITSILFTMLIARIYNRKNWSAIVLGGLLFATHPIHVEAVSGLVGRADVLSGMFFILAILTYSEGSISYCRGHYTFQIVLVLLSVVFIGLSVLCKETGITAAAAATVYELYVAQGLDPRKLIYPAEGSPLSGLLKKAVSNKEKAAKASARHAVALRLVLLWAGTAVVLLLRLSMNKQSITVDAKTNPANHMSEFMPRAMTKNLYVALHAWLLIFPKSLCCDWSGSAIALVESVWDGRNLATVALYTAIGFLGYEVTLSKRTQWFKAEMAFGLSLLVVPFLPATGLFMEVGFVLAERILYIPSMGFCFLAASLASQFSGVGGFKWRSQLGFLGAAVITAYSFKTYDRNFDWQSETPLYKTGIAIAPNNAKLHHNYAHSIDDDVSRKEFHLREAIRLYPPYISAYINLGVHLSVNERPSEAIAIYREGIRMHHKHPLYSTDVGMIYRNMALAHINMGDGKAALKDYQDCVDELPGNPKCTEKLAIAQRRYGEGGTGGPNAGGTKATMKKRPAPGATGGGTPPSKSKPKPKPVDATADGSFAAVPHVADEGYEAHRNANPRTFMMFYAPWCGHCNEMKPAFGELNRLSGGTGVVVAAVDCTSATKTCAKLGIDGYPTLRLFTSPSDEGTRFHGDRTKGDMLKWLTEQLRITTEAMEAANKNNQDRKPAAAAAAAALGAKAKASGAKDSGDGDSGSFDSIPKVTDGGFSAFRNANTDAFVMFFAPWCGHCTEMKPAFVEAARQLPATKFAAVDCTEQGGLCSRLEVTGYPMLLHYSGSPGNPGRQFKGERTANDMVEFVTAGADGDAAVGSDWAGSAVAALDDTSFDGFRAANTDALVMFYAPWCSHCREAKPAYRQAASQSQVKFGAVDCTVATVACAAMNIDAYPKFLRFTGDPTSQGQAYQGERTAADFVQAAGSP